MKLLCQHMGAVLRRQLTFVNRLQLALLAVLLLCSNAHADIWGYVDERGVAHFATEKLDDRYELYFKGGEAFNTAAGLPRPAGSGAAPAQVGAPLPTLSPRLLVFYDVSQQYKAVRHLMRQAARANNLDYELLKALISTESGFDPQAVSPKGAVGLMQLTPPTAERYGVKGDAKTPIEKKLTDPKTNIFAGARYLSDLLAMFQGNTELALAAYNAGEGAVMRYGKKIPPFKETQNYVRTVSAIYAALKPPKPVAEAQAQRSMPTAGVVQPSRVRIELGAGQGRGNMVPSGQPQAAQGSAEEKTKNGP